MINVAKYVTSTHNKNKTNHNKPVCKILGILCISITQMFCFLAPYPHHSLTALGFCLRFAKSASFSAQIFIGHFISPLGFQINSITCIGFHWNAAIVWVARPNKYVTGHPYCQWQQKNMVCDLAIWAMRRYCKISFNHAPRLFSRVNVKHRGLLIITWVSGVEHRGFR